MANKRINISDAEIIVAAKSFPTMAQAAKSLSMPFSTFKRYAKRLDVYEPNQSGKGLAGKEIIPLKKVLSNQVNLKPYHLKKKLWQQGIKEHKCESCSIEEIWQQQDLTLELHHVDGNKHNNTLSNLQILCPNCHSQTRTYRRKKSALLET